MSRTGLGRALLTSQVGRLAGVLGAALLTLSLAISSRADVEAFLDGRLAAWT